MSTRQKQLGDIPLIIHQTEDNGQFLAGQCDCSRFPPLHPSPLPEYADNDVYVLCDPFLSLSLTCDKYVTLGPHFGSMLLNRSALDVAHHFLQACSFETISASWRERWTDNTLYVTLSQMLKLGVLVPETSVNSDVTELSAALTAWLHITDHCNLRCTYCYLPQREAEMSFEVGKAAIDATFRSALAHNYQEVTLKYAGGEPLLHFELIPELHRYAQVLADLYGVSLNGVILTNGTLLSPGIVKQIQVMDLEVMISLDGVKNFHDCQRSYADGRGSFEAVSKGIDWAFAHGLVPGISITVSNHNVEGLPDLMSWVLDRKLPFHLKFCRQHPFSFSKTDLQLDEEKIITGMLAAYKVLESNLPGTSILHSLIDHANFAVPHLHPCSVGESYLVFDHQGRIATCQMDIRNTITNFRDPDPLARVRNSDKGIRNVMVKEKKECCDCQWRYWCTGGCPLLTYRATGRYDLKSPNCNIYKALYPEVLRLEGLRLLHETQEL